MVEVSKPGGLSRRDLFKALMAGLGASALGVPRLAMAATPAACDLHIIFAYFRGGWDLLLGLDPRDPRRFHDGNAGLTGIRPAYHLISGADRPIAPVQTRSGLMLGPCAAPLARHDDRLAVIRGLHMETLVHEAALYRFVTGRRWWGGQGRNASLASLLARKLAQGEPMPHLSIGIEQNGADAGQVRRAADLPAAMRLTSQQVAGFDAGSLSARAAAAVQAVTSGSSRVVTVEVARGLDTHGEDWRSQHFTRLTRGFAAVAEMADRLAAKPRSEPGDGSWLDHTLIFGFSELGRSPLLNAEGGRDHHLANACFLLGGSVAGGQALGATSDRGMEALAVDLASGRPDAAGRLLRPEHVLQTLLQRAGCQESANLGVPPLGAVFA